MCWIKSQKATKCVHIGIHVKSSSSHVQNTPQPCRQSTKLRIMIGSIKTKVVVKFQASEKMCVGLRAKKLRNVYTFVVHTYYVKSSSSHVQNTPQPCRQSTKLRIMIGSIKTKVVVKFQASEKMCVGLRAKKLRNVYTFVVHTYYVKSSSSHVQNTPQPCRQSTKLRIMIGSIKTKVVVKFEASDTMYVCWIKSLKATKCVHIWRTCILYEILILTCTEHTPTMSPVYET